MTLEEILAYYAETNADPIHEGRAKSLARAVELGADDATLKVLCDAMRVNRAPTIVLPAHRYEGLSRGRGWARKGRGDSAEWGERTDKGYRVGPGTWTVGGNDGFSRKGETRWTVKHVAVGAETWTVAS